MVRPDPDPTSFQRPDQVWNPTKTPGSESDLNPVNCFRGSHCRYHGNLIFPPMNRTSRRGNEIEKGFKPNIRILTYEFSASTVYVEGIVAKLAVRIASLEEQAIRAELNELVFFFKLVNTQF